MELVIAIAVLAVLELTVGKLRSGKDLFNRDLGE